MKRTNLTQFLAATLVVLSASSIAFASAPAQSKDSGQWSGKSSAQCQAKRAEMRQKFNKELGLSADQQKKIDNLRDSFKTAHKTEFDAMRAQYKELRAMKQSGATQDKIDAKRAAIHQQFAGLKADRQQLDAQIRATLTPEQAAKYDAMKARHHHHGDKGKGQSDQK